MYKYRVFIYSNSDMNELDTDSGESIPLCFHYNTMDFKFNSSFSYTYKIPLTVKNKELLGFYIKNNIMYSVRNKYYTSVVTMDDRLVFKGVINVTEVSKDSVSCSFITATNNFVSKLSNLKMWNAVCSAEYNKDDSNNVINSNKFQGTSDFNGGFFTYRTDFENITNRGYFYSKMIYENGQYTKDMTNYYLGSGKNQPVSFNNEMYINSIANAYGLNIDINNKKSSTYIPTTSTHCSFIPDKFHKFTYVSNVPVTCYSHGASNVDMVIAPILGVINSTVDPDTTWFSKSDKFTTTINDQKINCRYPNCSNSDCDIVVSPNSTFTIPQSLFNDFSTASLYMCSYKSGDFLISRNEKFIKSLNKEETFRVGDYYPDGIKYKKDGVMYFFSLRVRLFEFKKPISFILNYNIYIDGSTTLQNQIDVSSHYSLFMPDISITDYMVSYANIVNRGTIYYDTRDNTIKFKSYSLLENDVIDISEYISEISKVSKIFNYTDSYIYNEEDSVKNIIYDIDSNIVDGDSNAEYKSIISEISTDATDCSMTSLNTGAPTLQNRSDSLLYLTGTFFNSTIDGRAQGKSIVYANPISIKDHINGSRLMKSMFYNNGKVELTIKCSSKMVFDILDFNSRLKVQQLGSEFILNKATLTKDGAKLILIAI